MILGPLAEISNLWNRCNLWMNSVRLFPRCHREQLANQGGLLVVQDLRARQAVAKDRADTLATKAIVEALIFRNRTGHLPSRIE